MVCTTTCSRAPSSSPTNTHVRGIPRSRNRNIQNYGEFVFNVMFTQIEPIGKSSIPTLGPTAMSPPGWEAGVAPATAANVEPKSSVPAAAKSKDGGPSAPADDALPDAAIMAWDGLAAALQWPTILTRISHARWGHWQNLSQNGNGRMIWVCNR